MTSSSPCLHRNQKQPRDAFRARTILEAAINATVRPRTALAAVALAVAFASVSGLTPAGASPSHAPVPAVSAAESGHDMTGHDMTGHDMSGHDMSEMTAEHDQAHTSGVEAPSAAPNGPGDDITGTTTTDPAASDSTGTHNSGHGSAGHEDSGHGSGGATVATPDEAGRTAVLAGFGGLNLFVIAAAGLLRVSGRGAQATKLAKQAARSARSRTTRTTDHRGDNV